MSTQEKLDIPRRVLPEPRRSGGTLLIRVLGMVVAITMCLFVFGWVDGSVHSVITSVRYRSVWQYQAQNQKVVAELLAIDRAVGAAQPGARPQMVSEAAALQAVAGPLMRSVHIQGNSPAILKDEYNFAFHSWTLGVEIQSVWNSPFQPSTSDFASIARNAKQAVQNYALLSPPSSLPFAVGSLIATLIVLFMLLMLTYRYVFQRGSVWPFSRQTVLATEQLIEPMVDKVQDATTTVVEKLAGPTFCTQCGTLVEGRDDLYCRRCGAPVAAVTKGDECLADQSAVLERATLNVEALTLVVAPRQRRFVVTLLAIGTVVSITALLPHYYSGGTSLLDAYDLSYNLPLLIGMSVATGLVLSKQAWAAGVGVAVAVVLVDIAYSITDVDTVLSGQSQPGTGFWLNYAGLFLVLVGSLLAVRNLVKTRRPRLQSGPFAATWSVLGLIAGATWVVGCLLPDAGYHVHISTGTFRGTGTGSLTLIQGNSLWWQPASQCGQTIVLIVLIVGLPILAACLRWFGVGRGVLLGTAIALSSEWCSSAVSATQIAPTDFGWTAANAAKAGLTVTWFPTTGFVLLGVGTLGLVLLATTRLLLRR